MEPELKSTLAVTDATFASTTETTGKASFLNDISLNGALVAIRYATLKSTLAVTEATTLSSTLAYRCCCPLLRLPESFFLERYFSERSLVANGTATLKSTLAVTDAATASTTETTGKASFLDIFSMVRLWLTELPN